MTLNLSPILLDDCIGVSSDACRLLVQLSPHLRVWVAVARIRPESQVQAPGDCGTLVVEGWYGEKLGLDRVD